MTNKPPDGDDPLAQDIEALDGAISELRKVQSPQDAARSDSTAVSLAKSAMAYFGGAGMLPRSSAKVPIDGVGWAVTMAVFVACTGIGILGGWLWATHAAGSALVTHLVIGAAVGFFGLAPIVGAALLQPMVRRGRPR